ncbi:MAG: ABC transporter ATP-binding protein, partial [Dactylosporangium sp.]|nr:ABC transporter ATP-binding protein [Dactylosporangium sp.]
ECGALGHAALRRRIATVFQDYQTYAESIRDNVAFGAVDQPVDDDRIAWALKAAGFAEQELDLDRMLGPEHEGGTDLSGGQQQRLAIARALYRDADLLILDEPMSALDARAEHTLLAELRTMRRTTVLVSHRLANVAEADLILVFGAGRVIEEGTHEELMAHNGVYRELYQLQANLYSQGEGEISLSYGSVHEPERGRP